MRWSARFAPGGGCLGVTIQGVGRARSDRRPRESGGACEASWIVAGLFLCVFVRVEAQAATPADTGVVSVEPVRSVEVEFAVAPARPGAGVVIDPSTFRPRQASSLPSGFVVNVSAFSGRLRGQFQSDSRRTEPDAAIEEGRQELSLDYDLWNGRRNFAGRTLELSTTISHRLSFDTLHDPVRRFSRDDYRARSGVVFDGKIGTLEWGLSQGWSGGYLSASSGERSAAAFDTTFDASLPLATLARAAGFVKELEYAPKLLFRTSLRDAVSAGPDRGLSSEAKRRNGLGLSLGGGKWSARYMGSRRTRDFKAGSGASSVLRAVDHDVRFGFRPAESLRLDLGLRWDDIVDAGRRRTEVARTLDVGWRFADEASLAVGLFARERNERDAGTKQRKRGLETRLELPIRAGNGVRRMGALGGRLVVRQHVAFFDMQGAGGSMSQGTSWSVLCSLELSKN